MRIVEYSTECPGCKVEGVTRTLGFDPELGISCQAETPHTYAVLPGEPEASERPELEAETQQAAPTVPVAEDRGESQQQSERFTKIMQERNADGSVLDAAILERKEPTEGDLDASAQEEIITAATEAEPRRRDFSSQVEDDFPSGSGYVGEGQVRYLDGGDVLFGLRISEQWHGAIVAEAEVQGKSFEDYMQWFINEWALMNEWA